MGGGNLKGKGVKDNSKGEVAGVVRVVGWELEYNADEGEIVGEAEVKARVRGGLGLKGYVDWLDVEDAENGVLRSLESRILRVLTREVGVVDLEIWGEYRSDWERHGGIDWKDQQVFEIKGERGGDGVVKVRYRHEVGEAD